METCFHTHSLNNGPHIYSLSLTILHGVIFKKLKYQHQLIVSHLIYSWSYVQTTCNHAPCYHTVSGHPCLFCSTWPHHRVLALAFSEWPSPRLNNYRSFINTFSKKLSWTSKLNYHCKFSHENLLSY